jgi:predicted GNAT family acetyltransferase
MNAMEPIKIVNNERQEQFQASIDGEIAYMEYRYKDGMIVLMHTDVPDRLSGKGIATSLAAFAFKYAKEKGLKVKVYCPFVLTFVKRHPELSGQLAN